MIMLIISLYLFVLIISGMLNIDFPEEEKLPHKYVDDEPDGSNYVIMPDGERRLD